MLNYQSTSFHDALYVRRVLGLRPAPEFEAWLERMGIFAPGGGARLVEHAAGVPPAFARLLRRPRGVLSTHMAQRRDRHQPVEHAAPVHAGARRPRPRRRQPPDADACWRSSWRTRRRATRCTSRWTCPACARRSRRSASRHWRCASEAGDRATYLQRPDLGRQLAVASQRALDVLGLPYRADSFDIAFAVVDGLSSRAIHRHAVPFLREVLARLAVVGAGEPAGSTTWSVAPVAVVEQGRVAIGDVIGEALRARLVVVLIGERPGLSSPDSLGAYLTWEPRPGRTDAERNCLSNIRPEGLPYADAAARLVALLRDARRRELSGVALKDEHTHSARVGHRLRSCWTADVSRASPPAARQAHGARLPGRSPPSRARNHSCVVNRSWRVSRPRCDGLPVAPIPAERASHCV